MFSKDEINTGRQIEFDYIKGLFVPMILLVHAFQMLGGMAPAYQVFYIAATMTGSAIFMFVLGLGRVLRICTDKCRLYRILAVPAGIIVMVYFVRTTRINDGLDALYTYSDRIRLSWQPTCTGQLQLHSAGDRRIICPAQSDCSPETTA